MQANAERLISVLIHIQSHLDQDLSLTTLAEIADLSPHHFHRVFGETVGETVKQYTLRLRLERAAYWLKIHDAPVVDVAFQLGFNAHETFSRAFKRQFGITPKQFRNTLTIPKNDWQFEAQPTMLNHLATRYELSSVRITRLNPIQVAFIRQFGDYVSADFTHFDTLIEWAIKHGYYNGDNLLIGIGHDDPQITPTDKLRYDSCLSIDGDFQPTANIGCQKLPSGLYATLSYVGPYGHEMYQGYAKLFETISAMDNYRIVGIPAIEIYRTTRINPEYALNQTDLYVPIEKV